MDAELKKAARELAAEWRQWAFYQLRDGFSKQQVDDYLTRTQGVKLAKWVMERV